MALYKYSSPWDRFILYCGLFFSVAAGIVTPTIGIVYGKVTQLFDPLLTVQERHDMLTGFIGSIVAIVGLTFVCSWLGYAFMQISAERVSFQLRAKYLASLMRQEVEFFEKQQVEALPSKMAEYFTHIAEGSGDKTG